MPSLHDRDYPRPIVIEEDKSVSWILVIISIIIITIFLIWIIFIVRSNPPPVKTVVYCPLGQCATNIATGVKDCPCEINDVKSIDPKTQVCNPPTTCHNSATPYALQSDGSTNNDGICEANVQCQCLQTPQCGYHITAIFDTKNGDANQGLNSQRVVFVQKSISTDSNGNIRSNPPLQLASPTTQFCSIPEKWLDRVWPPVTNNASSPVTNNASSNNNSIRSLGPCILGTMAYLPNNPDNFDVSRLDSTPLGCVQGVSCPPGQVAFWNNNTYRVECLQQ